MTPQDWKNIKPREIDWEVVYKNVKIFLAHRDKLLVKWKKESPYFWPNTRPDTCIILSELNRKKGRFK